MRLVQLLASRSWSEGSPIDFAGRSAVVVAIPILAVLSSSSARAQNPVPVGSRLLPSVVEPPETPPCVPWSTGGPPSMTARLRMNRVGPMRSVYLFSGELCHQSEDLRIPGRGIDFVWARRYRSRQQRDTPMGQGWTQSYDISVHAVGGDLELHCWGREDLFFRQKGGAYIRSEFFLSGRENADGTYVFAFPDNGLWRFHALDGSPEAGKISTIVDRNGNTILLEYDVQGRLETIIDTLNRSISVSYDAAGKIASVTDFAGRSVQYEYYQVGETGGSVGDLKSARSPVVVGTPNGNDFPAGKTTLYTYSTGFADERLDHNLLTITDPKGQSFLGNVYHATTRPTALAFDRVIRQTWGDPGDRIDVHYSRRPSTGGKLRPVGVMATVNDRVGNVSEYEYDGRNRLVALRRCTGRAQPDLPTTTASNRPTGKLRASDPDFFETRLAWNADSLCTRVVFPEGDQLRMTYESTLVARAPVRSRGNLRRVVRLPGPRGATQPRLVESFTYHPLTNLLASHTDARGNTTGLTRDPSNGNLLAVQQPIASIVEDFEYNAFGQVTAHVLPDNGSGHRRRDEYGYYDTGPRRGYLEDVVVDATGLALTTTYDYDAVGNVIAVTDPRGNDALFTRNELNQVVRSESRQVDLGSLVRYQRDFFYDANDNLVQIDVQNVDDQGGIPSNSHFTTTYEYEILNHLTRVVQEVDPANNVATELLYDDNRNRRLVRLGEATNGNDPFNIVRRLHDERDLVYRMVRAEGDPVDQSTTQLDYDRNGRLVKLCHGLEGVPLVTRLTRDGYDRVVLAEDAMGNEVSWGYDANGNVLRWQLMGELVDVPGQSANVRLAETTCVYDVLDRVIQVDRGHFDPVTQAAIGDGIARTQLVWSDASLIESITNDNGNTSTFAHDTANRRATLTDAKGNVLAYAYDANSNVTSITSTEKSDLGNPDQVFTTTCDYDAVDRLTRITDNVGNQTECGYDSRSLYVRAVDAAGNESVYDHDGLLRLVLTVHDLDGDGASAADPDDIQLPLAWDDSSRLVIRTDGRGNATTYGYESRNLCSSMTMADGTSRAYLYDLYGRRTQDTDPNGTVQALGYDAVNRLTGKTITPGSGVAGTTTFESYQYDGRSRVKSAANDAATVLFEYDSLDNVVSETRGGKTTAATWDGVGNLAEAVYPGGRTIQRTFDVLERTATIVDTVQSIVDPIRYVGPRRVERCDLANGTRTELAYDGITGIPNPSGDFGVQQVIGTTHSEIMSGALIDDRSYGWDETYRKIVRDDLLASGPQRMHEYEHDPIHRLTRSIETRATGPVVTTAYALDKAGNRTSVTGGSDPGTYTMSATLPEPADSQVNQYTSTPFDARAYDRNGNLTGIDAGTPFSVLHSWDYRDRLVEVQDAAAGQRHTYAYDALGRRIQKVVDADGTPDVTSYYYLGSSVVEERSGADVTTATYVRSAVAREGQSTPVTMQRSGTDYYYHRDDLGNVMAVTDGAGSVVERYDYGDFGQVLVFDASHGPRSQSAIGNPYTFRGMRLDEETGLLLADGGSRYHDPRAGRYVPSHDGGAAVDGRDWFDGAGRTTYSANDPWSNSVPGVPTTGDTVTLTYTDMWRADASVMVESGGPRVREGGKTEMFDLIAEQHPNSPGVDPIPALRIQLAGGGPDPRGFRPGVRLFLGDDREDEGSGEPILNGTGFNPPDVDPIPALFPDDQPEKLNLGGTTHDSGPDDPGSVFAIHGHDGSAAHGNRRYLYFAKVADVDGDSSPRGRGRPIWNRARGATWSLSIGSSEAFPSQANRRYLYFAKVADVGFPFTNLADPANYRPPGADPIPALFPDGRNRIQLTGRGPDPRGGGPGIPAWQLRDVSSTPSP